MEVKGDLVGIINLFIEKIPEVRDNINSLQKIGIKEYLHSQLQKYYRVNTFLNRSEKVLFEKAYFPARIEHSKKVLSLKDLAKDLKNERYNVITGLAGSGKSMLMQYFALTSVSQSFKIPVLLELRYLNESKETFEEIIFKKLLNDNIEQNRKLLSNQLKKGNFLFLLDGVDEVYSMENRLNAINAFVDKYHTNYFIITSRPGIYFGGLKRFKEFTIKSLELFEIVDFITQKVSQREKKKKLTQIVRKEKGLASFVSNPLLLSMFILTFENHPEIPNKKSTFYWNVFDTLYSRHDGLGKNMYERKKLTGLKKDDFEKLLCVFSLKTFFRNVFDFDRKTLHDTLNDIKRRSPRYDFSVDDLVYDLAVSISIWIQDGITYKFPHRTMQEYFAARFITQLKPEKKEEVYNIYFEKVISNSSDLSFSFWDLCYEVDKTGFAEYFIIPNTKAFLDILRTNNPTKIFAALELCLFYRTVNGTMTNDKFLKIELKNQNKMVQILNYFKLNKELDELKRLLGKSDAFDILKRIGKNGVLECKGETIKFDRNRDLSVKPKWFKYNNDEPYIEHVRFFYSKQFFECLYGKQLLKHINFERIVGSLIYSLEKNIEMLENDLKLEENEIDDILTDIDLSL